MAISASTERCKGLVRIASEPGSEFLADLERMFKAHTAHPHSFCPAEDVMLDYRRIRKEGDG